MMLNQLQKQAWIINPNGNPLCRARNLVQQRTPFLDFRNQQFELCVSIQNFLFRRVAGLSTLCG